MLKKLKKGFTLLELIVVLGILATIVAVPSFVTVKENSAKSTLLATAQTMHRNALAIQASNEAPSWTEARGLVMDETITADSSVIQQSDFQFQQEVGRVV